MITIIFDTETTGLIRPMETPLAKQPKVIEIFARMVEGKKLKTVDEFHALYQPGEKLDPKIIEITKIDDDMLKGKPRWAKLHEDAVKFFKKADRVAGHNLTFDMDMLNLETRRYLKTADRKVIFPWPKKQLCTVEATEHLLGRRMKLSELHTHLFKEAFDGAHRAKADVDALHRCMIELTRLQEID